MHLSDSGVTVTTVTDQIDALKLPPSLSSEHRDMLAGLVRRNEADYGEDLLGMVLSGSAGRGMATERSDIDVFTVLTDTGGRRPQTSRSAALDETIVAISDLERVPPFGTEGWWYRWSFAWAPMLLDRTEGRLASALHRQATVTADEAESILVEHDRLDGWLNFAYRTLKNDRDGRSLERRLDAAESMPWLLDVIFTLEGRVRPYHKYLPWELRQHPLTLWHAGELLALLTATLDGDPSAIRATFQRVETACAAFDSQVAVPVLTPVIESWGDELQILRH
ncbi:hypothetical protein Aau02nite_72670 [Amorphoplanes auranticolor]|uniref:Nucleotidyltransferase-like protein n=1 Tax=Actinoplanes auranticolor TaxID=47988 RepID=A0A919SPV3_9ACTN|nr:hypothetical protein Aau02nite_72670 [Actinoplanes auranticolor]